MQYLYSFFLVVFCFGATQSAAQTSADVVVPITVTTSASPASITLSWTNPVGLSSVVVARKGLTQTAWTLLAQLPTSATTFKDSTIVVGGAYEYLVLQQATTTPSQRIGLVYAGVRAGAITAGRGKIILVIDSNLSTPLATELAVFLDDLRGDGWQPIVKSVTTATATVGTVKQLLKETYDLDPTRTIAAFLIGDIPVPYSGNINPDGHPEHRGAWPTDYYYGDMDESEWTDAAINNPAAGRPQNRNIPNDGKFDQSQTPTLPELIVSRLDFSNLSGWDVSQTELYRRYLNKNHRFKSGQYVPQQKTLVDDNFGYFSGEAFAQNGWRNGYALTGPSNTAIGDFFNDTDNQSFLFGYGTGPGSYTSAGGVGSSDNFKTDSVNIVFSQLFGSYHGDWDYETNPFMPSALASKGGILTCSWAGRPNWALHHMGLGEPIMTSTYWVWLNSFLDSPVYPTNFGADLVHVGLLGDPTLRAHATKPPSAVTAASNCDGTGIRLNWTASPDATDGYLIYRAPNKDSVFTLLTPTPVVGLTYLHTTPLTGNNVYQVKALQLRSVPTGSYFNQSTGIIASAQYGSQISFTVTPQSVACAGASTGAITLNVAPSSGTVSYLWNTGATSKNLTGLSAGTYTVSVSNTEGCTATATATITQGTALSLSASSTNIACFGQTNGTINLAVGGGQFPYTYLWSNSKTTQNLNGLAAGIYTVTMTDALGCTQTTNTLLTEPALLSASATTLPITCFGGNTCIDLTVSGGTPGYVYNWSNSSNVQDICQVGAGNYTVTTTDSKGCTTVVMTTVTQAPALTLSLTATSNCQTGDANLTANAGGGTGAIAYLWSNAATTQAINNLSPNTYTVTITDANGCTKVSSTTVTTSGISLQTAVENIRCNGNTNGAINLTVSGGAMPYSYLWSNAATTQDLSNLSVGTYLVTITDANGCSATNSAGITQPAVLSASLVTQPVACFGASTGCVDLTTSGGTAPFTYFWSNTATTQSICNLAAGTYTLTTTDANGCSATASAALAQATPLALSVTIASNCLTGNASLTAVSGGGTSPYAYFWSNNATTQTISQVPVGAYTVTLTDINGCTKTTSASVTASGLSLQTTATPSNCFGGNDAAVSVAVSGGTAPFSYLWSNAATTQSINNLSLGTYTVTTTDANGCSSTATATATQPPQLELTTTTIIEIACVGGSGCIDLALTGGTPPYSYQWSDGSTTENLCNNLVGNNNYTITVTDSKGCTKNTVATLTIPVPITLALTTINVTCFGGSNGCVDLSTVGGAAPFNYNWSNGVSTQDQCLLTAGAYTVTVTDGKNCSQTTSVVITQPSSLPNAGIVVTNAICNGSSTGAINLTLTGGTPTYTVNWAHLPGNNDPQDLENISAGQYSATITDNNGCTITSSATVTQPAIAVILIEADTSCRNDVETYLLPNGLVATNWSLLPPGGTIFESNPTNAVVAWAVSGSYTLTATASDTAGCKTRVDFPVFVDPCLSTSNLTLEGVTVLPNPFGAYIQVQLDRATPADIRLTDVQGRVLVQQSGVSGIGKLETNHLPSGTYFLQVVQGNQAGVWKVIKAE